MKDVWNIIQTVGNYSQAHLYLHTWKTNMSPKKGLSQTKGNIYIFRGHVNIFRGVFVSSAPIWGALSRFFWLPVAKRHCRCSGRRMWESAVCRFHLLRQAPLGNDHPTKIDFSRDMLVPKKGTLNEEKIPKKIWVSNNKQMHLCFNLSIYIILHAALRFIPRHSKPLCINGPSNLGGVAAVYVATTS